MRKKSTGERNPISPCDSFFPLSEGGEKKGREREKHRRQTGA